MTITLTPDIVRAIRGSYERIAPHSDELSEAFYERLFFLEPRIRRLFADDLTQQRRALLATLSVAVEALDRPDQLLPVVEQLGLRHAGYGVTADHYPIVGNALLWALERMLGPAFTPELRAAWAAVYEQMATTMQRGVRVPAEGRA